MEEYNNKNNLIDRTGEEHITNEGYKITIKEYRGCMDLTVIFENGYERVCTYNHVKTKNISNPYHKSVFGIGYYGVGKHKAKINYKNTRCYQTWVNIIERCYSEKRQEKQPTYKGCSVAEEWHNFQNFAEWFENNYRESFHLDKDILQKGNKVYSPNTCCFVPQEINGLLVKNNINRGEYPIGMSLHKKSNRVRVTHKRIGRIYTKTYDTIEESFQAYKETKEAYIKEVINKWEGKIDPKVYQALYNYQVEITD